MNFGKISGFGLATLAGLFLSTTAMAEKPIDAAQRTAPTSRVEVVFVVDTTGSMADLIEGAKRKIWSIANTIVDQSPDAEIRIGLVAYRDIGDTYVTRSFELTTDIQGIYGKLLTFEAAGGGDTPESVNEALDVAVLKQGWSGLTAQVPTKRVIFLVGDAPPHMDYKQDRKYPVILKDARQRGIIVNAVQAGDMRQTTKVWKEIAQLGDGDYIAIPQDGGKVKTVVTPYDDEIRKIQGALNTTILPYGAAQTKDVVRGKAESYAAAPVSSAAEMSKFVNKSGKGKDVITGAGDLVADVNNGTRKLADVPDAELPDAMKPMAAPEREAYLADQSKKRDELARQLADKVKQRDGYVREQEAKQSKAGAGDSFDEAVSQTLRKQLK